jgi:hypothetical protein
MLKSFGVGSPVAKPTVTPAELYLNSMERVGGPTVQHADAKAGMDYLTHQFGLRAIQWGNSVPAKERQKHVTHLTHAMLDLSHATGLDPSELSLGGKLALAIGARGRGKANAHYEPSLRVINLTKEHGAGSLGHEWFHALDHEMSDGKSGNALLSQQALWGNNPIHRAMNDLTAATRSFRSRVIAWAREKRLPEGMVKYLASSHELAARAFDKHLQAQLSGSGRRNDYLAGATDHPVFPTKEELAKISPALNGLLQAYKTHRAPK